jgi:uncharacterized protein YukE
MVSYPDLRDVDPQAWSAIGGAFRVWAEAVADSADELAGVIHRLSPVWVGVAATAALVRLTSLRASLKAAYPALVSIDQALCEFSTAVASAQAALHDAAEPRPGSIVEVDTEGVAVLVPRDTAPDPGDTADLLRTSRALAASLSAANAADREVKTRLGSTEFAPDAVAAPPSTPPIGTDPAVVAAWWSTRSDDEQRYLILTRPALVDALDGVPADSRDQAGRILLHQQRMTFVAREVTAPTSALDALRGELAGMSRLADRLDDPHLDRAYLLDLDADDNRATVAIDDPDRAAGVLTMVPGVGSGLGQIGSTLSAIDNIHDAGGVAAIGWLEYDAPATIQAAMRRAPAMDAAPSLSRFDLGVRDTHIGPAAHDSILGYSYGATVVGDASRVRPLQDDDVIFVGAPGVGVDHAADLGVDPAHVWATVAEHDPIRLAVNPVARLEAALTGHDSSQMWFGTAPTSAAFGGRVFTSDPGSWQHPLRSHLTYFEAGSQSLKNIAKIASGNEEAVS